MNINLYAPIGITGYGNVALNLLKQLVKQEHNICLTPIGNPKVESESDLDLIHHAVGLGSNIDYNATCVKIWHQFDLLTRSGNGKYLAYPFFEIDTFNTLEKHHLGFPDKLIASSQWAKNVLLDNGIKKEIDIVHLGVDNTIFYPRELKNTRPNNFIFITIGKWEVRKSHDIIIECFNKAFSNQDNVELWMVTHNPFLNEAQEKEWLSLVNTSKLKNKIKVFPRLPNQENLAEVLSYADCGLYVSRAEGWNLEILETMAMNKPVITTNYSAHTEYCNTKNAYLVDITEKELAEDGKWFHSDGNWAKIGEKEKDQIIEYMKYVYDNKINTNLEGVQTSQNFTWENSAKQLVRCIEK
jgi:glycosyltransferase involved in cell wall biosynthesis